MLLSRALFLAVFNIYFHEQTKFSLLPGRKGNILQSYDLSPPPLSSDFVGPLTNVERFSVSVICFSQMTTFRVAVADPPPPPLESSVGYNLQVAQVYIKTIYEGKTQ